MNGCLFSYQLQPGATLLGAQHGAHLNVFILWRVTSLRQIRMAVHASRRARTSRRRAVLFATHRRAAEGLSACLARAAMDPRHHDGADEKKSGGGGLSFPDFVPIATGERPALANVLACPRAAALGGQTGEIKWPNRLPTFRWRRSPRVFGPILWHWLSAIVARNCAISKA